MILLKRSPNNYGEYADKVQVIVDDVKARKDEALLEYTEKFDGVKLTSDELLVTKEEIEEAYTKVDEKLIGIIRRSKANIEKIPCKTETEKLV